MAKKKKGNVIVIPLTSDPDPWKDFELMGGISFSAEEGIHPNAEGKMVPAIYYTLNMIITFPAARKREVENDFGERSVEIKRGYLENFKLTIKKAYARDGGEFLGYKVTVTHLDNARWRIAQFPQKQFSDKFFIKYFTPLEGEMILKFRDDVIFPSVREVFDTIYNIFDYYLDLERERLIFFTIYTLATYFYKLFPTFPYLYLFGAMESGKTKTLSIFEQLAFNGLMTVNFSASSLFRVVELFGAVLCIDESEYLKDTEKKSELQYLLYAGYKAVGKAMRTEGERIKTVRTFHVYSPKIMASINYPNILLLSRCIITNMRRGMKTEKLNRAPADNLYELRDKILLMLFDRFHEVYQLRDMDFQHELLVGREHELWRPLFVIAQWLKQHMPDRAREIDEAMITMLEQDISLKQSLRIDSDLITILYVLTNNIKESGFVTLQTIRDLILDEYRMNDMDYKTMSRYWSPERIGRQLASLGFKRSKRQGKTYYFIDLHVLQERAKAYNVSSGDGQNTMEQSNSMKTGLDDWQ